MFAKLAILSIAAIAVNAKKVPAPGKDPIVSIKPVVPPKHETEFINSLNNKASWKAYRDANQKNIKKREGLRAKRAAAVEAYF